MRDVRQPNMTANPWGLRSGRAVAKAGFTLLELLVVIAIIAILAGLLLPAVNRSKQKALSIRCVSNLRQLQIAWQMYADEFADACVPNTSRFVEGGDRGDPDTWAGENNAAVDVTDELLLKGLFLRLRLVENLRLFRCPADHATVQRHPRTRSYAMSAYWMETHEDDLPDLQRLQSALPGGL